MNKIVIAFCLMVFIALLSGNIFNIRLCFAQEVHHGHQHLAAEDSLAPSGELTDNVRVVKVEAFKYGFKPDPIVVKRGEKVKLEVTSKDVAHGLGISEFGVNVAVPSGKTVSAEFIAGKAGDFPIRCTVYCGSGHGDMHGTLKVIE